MLVPSTANQEHSKTKSDKDHNYPKNGAKNNVDTAKVGSAGLSTDSFVEWNHLPIFGRGDLTLCCDYIRLAEI